MPFLYDINWEQIAVAILISFWKKPSKFPSYICDYKYKFSYSFQVLSHEQTITHQQL